MYSSVLDVVCSTFVNRSNVSIGRLREAGRGTASVTMAEGLDCSVD